MTSPNPRMSGALPRVAAVALMSALALLVFAAPAASKPTKPPTPAESSPAPTDPSAVPTDPSAVPTDPSVVPTDPDAALPTSNATDAPAPDRTLRVKSPGTVTCEDLDLGVTLQKVNGARKNKVIADDGVSSVVKDTDVDGDGDPDSLFATIEEGTVATAVVALHGNRANIYEDTYAAGDYGPFYSPSQPTNTHPPVTHRLICGAAVEPSDSPSVAPSETPSETPSSPAPGNGGGLPTTGLALTGLIVAGAGMVGAGIAMRALRRKKDPETEAEDGEEPTEV